MVFNRANGRIKLEPGDVIRCRDKMDAAILADIFADKDIPWEFIYNRNGEKGIWLIVLDKEAADE